VKRIKIEKMRALRRKRAKEEAYQNGKKYKKKQAFLFTD
jgi:hypothetical protein